MSVSEQPRYYFAYGSNLSLEQMGMRCPGNTFVGTAWLPNYRWIINARGYANVVSHLPNPQPTDCSDPSTYPPDSIVWGVIYTLTASDEVRLDINEGVAIGCYEKFDLPVHLTTGPLAGREVNALVYVDRLRTTEGPPMEEYICRINRGLRDCADIPKEWVEAVVRRFIPAKPSSARGCGGDARDDGVGGFVEDGEELRGLFG